ncbi:MAG: hypothetical protein Hyperionvirus1_99 [Hyperionvirus sp.]|uniref:Uncharacterized protein n=1 Tax=Hyperionvirus sp. TaxID=2487770 RepID=A0A3G5A5J1_9VIRU|nr:MAG: hypothetical protein Hyperionvirus1_99 [Hyperionvirus sp.]
MHKKKCPFQRKFNVRPSDEPRVKPSIPFLEYPDNKFCEAIDREYDSLSYDIKWITRNLSDSTFLDRTVFIVEVAKAKQIVYYIHLDPSAAAKPDCKFGYIATLTMDESKVLTLKPHVMRKTRGGNENIKRRIPESATFVDFVKDNPERSVIHRNLSIRNLIRADIISHDRWFLTAFDKEKGYLKCLFQRMQAILTSNWSRGAVALVGIIMEYSFMKID